MSLAFETPEDTLNMSVLNELDLKVFKNPDGSFNPKAMAQAFGKDSYNKLLTPLNDDGGDIIWRYEFNEGVWKPDGIPFIRQVVTALTKKKAKARFINEVVELARIETYKPRSEFVEDPSIIVLQNGSFDVTQKKFVDNDYRYNSKSRLPVTYDAAAKCPTFLKFLDEVSAPGDIPVIQEWFGFHLLKDYRFHKCCMLIGGGRNGKSTLLNVLKTFLGPENVSNASLFELISNRFASSELYGRLANISPDISSDELKRTGIFKALTGGDTLRAEKKHQAAFNFVNFAKLSFSANQLPISPDQSRAFFSRWLILSFNNTFEGKNQDTSLLGKLTTTEELSGIFNWAYAGLKRLLSKGDFSKSETAEDISKTYELMADPISAFVNHCVDELQEGEISKDEMYNHYWAFCKMRGYPTVLKSQFGQELKPRLPTLVDYQKREKSEKRVQSWRGVQVKCALYLSEPEKAKECTNCKYIEGAPNPAFQEKLKGGRDGSDGRGVSKFPSHPETSAKDNTAPSNPSVPSKSGSDGRGANKVDVSEQERRVIIAQAKKIIIDSEGSLGIILFKQAMAKAGFDEMKWRPILAEDKRFKINDQTANYKEATP